MRRFTTLQEELFAACCHNEGDTVRKLVAAGAVVNQAYENGLTPLQVAARAGAHDALAALLDVGADARAVTGQGLSALDFLGRHGEANHSGRERENLLQSARLLRAVGCQWTISDAPSDPEFLSVCKGGKTQREQYSYPSITPEENLQRAKDFVEAATPEYPEDAQGNSILMMLIGWNPALPVGFLQCMLAREVAWLNHRNHRGYTALHLAALRGYTRLMEHLLSAGADIHASDNKGNTPLHAAAKHGCSATVRLLLSAGADIHARNNRGYTPLHIAALQGHFACCDTLLQAGANPSAATVEGVLPLTLAMRAQRHRVADLLRIFGL